MCVILILVDPEPYYLFQWDFLHRFVETDLASCWWHSYLSSISNISHLCCPEFNYWQNFSMFSENWYQNKLRVAVLSSKLDTFMFPLWKSRVDPPPKKKLFFCFVLFKPGFFFFFSITYMHIYEWKFTHSRTIN